MKTILKLAKAELMLNPEYSQGDFTMNFVRFEAIMDKSVKVSNHVIAVFDVFNFDGTRERDFDYIFFTFGFVTPKGYKSSKSLPFQINDPTNLSLQDVSKLKEFKAEYKLNTFDPFYAQKQAERKKVSAWNYIATNYMHDPYDKG